MGDSIEVETPADIPEPTGREKWVRECEFREREIRVKELEQHNKSQELEAKRVELAGSGWRSPLVVAIMAASIAALGNAGVALTNGIFQRQLEDEKAELARILEMVKTGSPDKAADNLAFLINIGLVSRKIQVEKLADFLSKRQPGEGPALPSADGTREVREGSYHPAQIKVGQRAVNFQVREQNNDPKRPMEANPGVFTLNGESIAYADESTYEIVRSVGAEPEKMTLTGHSLKGDYMEVTVREHDFAQDILEEKVFKEPIKNGQATFTYQTHKIDLAAILKSKTAPPGASAKSASGR